MSAGSKSSKEETRLLTSIKQTISSTITLLLFLSLGMGVILGLIIKAITGHGSMFSIILVCVAFNIVLGILLFMLISKSTKRSAKGFTEVLEAVSTGKLNISSTATGNNKLLNKIQTHLHAVAEDMHSVISGTTSLTKSIIESSIDMTEKVQIVTESINGVSQTIDEIATGASKQATEAENSVQIMENLSQQISIVSKNYDSIIQETDHVNDLNKSGLYTVQTLREKSEVHNDAFEKISMAVGNLAKTLANIETFVSSIKDIADQTNLLALNAAIEAARAGEAGKGFAVVADEVRKLADESKGSTEEISNLMMSIEEDSREAIAAMNSAKIVSQQQAEAVNQTDSSFKEIAKAIDAITMKINDMNDAIRQMESGKDQSISAIKNTAVISEQTAAASEELAATVESQLNVFEEMRRTAENLSALSNDMNERLKKYNL